MKNNLVKTRRLWNSFKLIDDLNFINDGREFESNNCNINPLESKLYNGNTDKPSVSSSRFGRVGSFELASLINENHLLLLPECQTSQVMYNLT